MNAARTGASRDDLPRGARTLRVRGYLAILIADVAIVLLGTLVTLGSGEAFARYTDAGDVWSRLVLRYGLSLVFVYAVVAALRWWRPVVRDHRPVRRWVWVVPGILGFSILAGTNYGGLADQPVGFVALLLLGSMVIGFGEEGMFRGLGVVTFRSNGYGEGRVALWTTLLFALSHAPVLLGGPVGLIQLASTLIAGYCYYLTRRVSGSLVPAALLHGLWDFGLFSAGVVEGETYGGVAAFFTAQIVIVPVLLLGRKRIEPPRAVPAGSVGSPPAREERITVPGPEQHQNEHRDADMPEPRPEAR